MSAKSFITLAMSQKVHLCDNKSKNSFSLSGVLDTKGISDIADVLDVVQQNIEIA